MGEIVVAFGNIPKYVQYCETCGKKLIEGTSYHGKIGSPLICCKRCNTTQVTRLRTEWYNYPMKGIVWVWPVVLPIGGFIGGLIMGRLPIGILVGLISLVVGLGISSVTLVKAFLSNRRMRSIAYLDKLVKYKRLSRREYEAFRKKAK